MGVCSVPRAATAECSHRSRVACFLTWKRSSPASRTRHSHLSCQKYKVGASQSYLNRELPDHTPITICQSGSTAESALADGVLRRLLSAFTSPGSLLLGHLPQARPQREMAPSHCRHNSAEIHKEEYRSNMRYSGRKVIDCLSLVSLNGSFISIDCGGPVRRIWGSAARLLLAIL